MRTDPIKTGYIVRIKANFARCGQITDGHGGTLITDPPPPTSAAQAPLVAHH